MKTFEMIVEPNKLRGSYILPELVSSLVTGRSNYNLDVHLVGCLL